MSQNENRNDSGDPERLHDPDHVFVRLLKRESIRKCRRKARLILGCGHVAISDRKAFHEIVFSKNGKNPLIRCFACELAESQEAARLRSQEQEQEDSPPKGKIAEEQEGYLESQPYDPNEHAGPFLAGYEYDPLSDSQSDKEDQADGE